MEPDWPFAAAPNTASITVRPISEGEQPIRSVVHYADDDTWGFFTGEEFQEREAVLVALSSVVTLDRSVRVLADLPPGGGEWRDAVDQPWQCAPDEDQAD